jgi:Flp pilus assembly protein TadD
MRRTGPLLVVLLAFLLLLSAPLLGEGDGTTTGAADGEPAATPQPVQAGPEGTSGAGQPVAGSEQAGPQGMVGRLRELFDAGNDKEVVALGEEYLARFPADADARLLVAWSLMRQSATAKAAAYKRGLFHRAFNHLMAAQQSDPSRLAVRVALMDVLYHLERHDQLLTEAKSLLDERPRDQEAADEVGFYAEQYLRDGRPSRAVEVCRLLAAARPQTAQVVSNLGTTLILAGNLDEGIATLLRAEKLAPGDADTAHNLAQAYLYQGDQARALEWFARTSKARPESGRFLLDLAVVKAIASPVEAAPLFDKAGEILGGNPAQKTLVDNLRTGMTSPLLKPPDIVFLARDLRETGYPVYAMAALEKLPPAESARLDAILLRAQILDENRFFRRSLAEYRRAAALTGGLPEAERVSPTEEAIAGQARALTALGDGKAALDLLRSTGKSERFILLTAEALIASGDLPGGLALMEQAALSSDPQLGELAREKLRELSERIP